MEAQETTALYWLNQGVATIPIGYRSKRPNFSALIETGDVDDYGRATWERLKTELPTEAEIKTWYKRLSNIGLVCGWRNLVVLDFDTIQAFNLWYMMYRIDSHMVRSARGVHVYVYLNSPPELTLKWWGGDIKAGGYVLIPPSVHPSGATYKAIPADIVTFNSLADLFPDTLLETMIVGSNSASSTIIDDSPFRPGYQPPCDNPTYTAVNQTPLTKFFKSGVGNSRWLMVRCPFHDDRHSSAWIDLEKNRFGCHACLNGSLSAIDFYMRLNNVDKETAVRELQKI